jgi:hypothetical protein
MVLNRAEQLRPVLVREIPMARAATYRFQSRRARLQSLLVGFGGAALLIALSLSFFGRHSSSGTTAAWIELAGAIPFLYLGFRGFVAGTVIIDGRKLIYQTKYTTHKYLRSDICEVSASVRFWLTRTWSQPWLQLSNGRKVWLVDWSVPPPRSRNSTSRYLQEAEFKQQTELVQEIRNWLVRDDGL